jgi:hypothetical protein
MHHRGADECLHRGAVLLGKDVGADRSGDEHEADQGRRRRADQQVEIVPSVEVVCERRLHGELDDSRNAGVNRTPRRARGDCLGGLVLNFGPALKLPYAPDKLADVFVITSGGLGSIA